MLKLLVVINTQVHHKRALCVCMLAIDAYLFSKYTLICQIFSWQLDITDQCVTFKQANTLLINTISPAHVNPERQLVPCPVTHYLLASLYQGENNSSVSVENNNRCY